MGARLGSAEELLFLDLRDRLRGARSLCRSRRLLCSARRRFGRARGVGDSLLFYASLGGTPLRFVAPLLRAALVVLAPCLVEAACVRRASFLRRATRFFGRARRSRRPFGLGGGTIGVDLPLCLVRLPLRFVRSQRLLRGAHRVLRLTRGLGGALGLGSASRIRGELCLALRIRDTTRLFGGARGLFVRPASELGGTRRLGRALRLGLTLRLRGPARFLLRGARLICRGVRLAGRVRGDTRLTADVLEKLCEHATQRFGRLLAGIRRGPLDRPLGRRIAPRTAQR